MLAGRAWSLCAVGDGKLDARRSRRLGVAWSEPRWRPIGVLVAVWIVAAWWLPFLTACTLPGAGEGTYYALAALVSAAAVLGILFLSILPHAGTPVRAGLWTLGGYAFLGLIVQGVLMLARYQRPPAWDQLLHWMTLAWPSALLGELGIWLDVYTFCGI